MAARNPMAMAQTCGAIAGMDANFIASIKELRLAMDRCDVAMKGGLLTAAQYVQVRDVRGECQKLIPTIEGLWRDIDTLSRSGVALPKKETKTGDLFA